MKNFKQLQKFFKQFFCWHRYVAKNPEEKHPAPPKYGAINYCIPSTCNKCSKEKDLYTGWVS